MPVLSLVEICSGLTNTGMVRRGGPFRAGSVDCPLYKHKTLVHHPFDLHILSC